MKQHGLHAEVVHQVHNGLGLADILLCGIQLRLVDDLQNINSVLVSVSTVLEKLWIGTEIRMLNCKKCKTKVRIK